MSQVSRRRFLRNTLSATAGSYMAMASSGHLMPSARGANDEIRVAVAGIRSRGGSHIKGFQNIPGVNVVALCEPDKEVLAKRVADLNKDGNTVKGYADIRELLDRKDIDVLSIATPNHWHSLMTVWACQAGKDVYVEKPVSHSIWEGRKMVEAARKYKRIVQAGTQHRSCPAVQELARDIKAERWGKVQWIHCSRLGARQPIGKVTTPQPVPKNIDYNLWAGPAPMTPVMRKSFHYDWHWQWNWGDGEMANWGVHYLDDVRHFMGWDDVPNKIVAAGNRFAWDDNGETPNMHMALCDYDGIPLVIDVRNLVDPWRRSARSGALYMGRGGGNLVQCDDALIHLSRGGGGAYDKKNKRIHQYKGTGGRGHFENFIDAVRSRRGEDLVAEIEIGHLSTVVCHQANVAWRAGAEATVDEVYESMRSHKDALYTLTDMMQQMAGNGIDLTKEPFVLGPQLTYDRKQERFVGANAEKANKFVKCSYRDGFVVPENV
jgi:predicted dehydrogenase